LVADFIPLYSKNKDEFIKKISVKLGFPVKHNTFIWQIARKLKNQVLPRDTVEKAKINLLFNPGNQGTYRGRK